MTFQPKPLPSNWQTDDPENLRRQLNRMTDALTDAQRQVSDNFVTRTESIETGGVPTLRIAQYAAQFGKALRVPCPTGLTTRVVLPAATAADAFRDVHLIRTSANGTLTALPSAGYLINGATLAAVPNALGMYTYTFDGQNFYGRGAS